jgi:hypothetical protein
MRIQLTCAAVSGCLLLVASLGGSQARTGEVRGRIFEATDSSRAVVSAAIELAGTAIRGRSDVSGRFFLPEVLPGEYELRVRRLGFKSVTRRVTVTPDTLIVADVALHRTAAELTEVVIEGKKVWVPPRLGEVYTRAARGWGKLFTADDIRQQNPSDLGALLNTVPTVTVNDRGMTFNRCQAGLDALGSALSGGGTNQYSPGKVQIYVDGMRLSSSSGPDRDATRILAQIHPSNVAAMEVYTGVARLPGEFHSDACAAIAIWTKSY